MKGLIFKGSSLTCYGEHLNAIIYNKNLMLQALNLTNPIKPNKTQKPTGLGLKQKTGFFPTLLILYTFFFN
jgi:hypothetical protein